jgi:predicted metal-dependent phosphoesterase TrpH
MDLDLHIHSNYSFDSYSRIVDILKIAKKKGLGGLAITDHNTIKGSLNALKVADEQIIISGCEIGTEIGDIIGLFINEEIKSRLSFEVIEEIRDQGGLAVIAHPFKRKRNLNNEIIKKIDAVEVFNARATKTNERARKIAEDYNLPITAGSDAHFCFEVGRGRIIVQNAFDTEAIRKSILKKQVSIKGTDSDRYLDIFSQSIRVIKQKRFKNIHRKIYECLNYRCK